MIRLENNNYRWSIVAILTYNQLNNQRYVFHLLQPKHLLRTLIIIIFLFYQIVDSIEIVTNLFLKIDSQSLDLTSDRILIPNSRYFLEIEVFWCNSIVFPTWLVLDCVLSLYTSFHIPQEETVTLLLKGLLLFIYTPLIALFL